MNNDYLFSAKQFNDGLLTTLSSLLNDSFRDVWRKSHRIEHLKIEVLKLNTLYSNETILDPRLFEKSEWNARSFPFGPNPIKSLVTIDLSKIPLSIIRNLNSGKLSTNTLQNYRYSFYVGFQIFLTNCQRGTNPGAILAQIEEFNPTIFDLLNDHIDDDKKNDDSIAVKTLQKRSERFFKRIGMASTRNGLFKEIMACE